jgi:N-acetylglucosaminyldiphosphoundecaprenol N-acetyl-beta-D-mannosaminyltransferase
VTTATPESGTRVRVDFERDVHAIGGLPVDAVGMEEAVRRVRAAAHGNARCILSTPNLNFVQLAVRDPVFRASVCRSDLVVADGMPLVWMARALGAPIRERVSGAGLFEALCRHPGRPVTVYFYGGPPGAAAAAGRRLPSRGGGLVCVGHETPPFVASADALDSESAVARINASGAQFVIVSLGAVKGQAWIDRHAARLDAPVISHLGAVVNFAAGTVRRAPEAWQRTGLEWLWRIREEPALWRRYWNDGRWFAGMAVRELLPFQARARLCVDPLGAPQPGLAVEEGEGSIRLSCSGAWRRDRFQAMRSALAQASNAGAQIDLDASGISHADASFIALLILARIAFGSALRMGVLSEPVRRSIRACGAMWIATPSRRED